METHYIITFNGRPVTLARLYALERHTDNLEPHERDVLIAHRHISQCRATYLHHFGFTWAERTRGVEVTEFEV